MYYIYAVVGYGNRTWLLADSEGVKGILDLF